MANPEQIKGIVGPGGAPRSPVVEGLLSQGVLISPKTVSEIRTGLTSGEKVQHRLDCSEALSRDDVTLKLNFLNSLIGVALDSVQFQKAPYDDQFLTVNFLENVGTNLGLSARKMRNIFLTMNSDVAYIDSVFPNYDGIRDRFELALDDYYTRTERKKVAGASLRQAVEDWKRKRGSITDFYRDLYSRGPRSIAAWSIYELPFLKQHYKDHPRTLSRLDELVLRSRVRDRRMEDLVEEIRHRTGVPVNDNSVDLQRNLIVYGSPYQK